MGSAVKAAIGIRRVGNEQRLVLRLEFRKNTRTATISIRPCCCVERDTPTIDFPHSRLCVAIIADANPGDFLTPRLVRAILGVS